MVDMAKRVLAACEADIDAEMNENGKRPADVYRRWAEALRWIVKHELTPVASRVLRELVREQSLPALELDNPEWIDPYTGEVDMAMNDRVTIHMPQERDDIEAASIASSEGFDEDDEMEKMYHNAELTEEAEWDVREPTWMEIQNDLKPSEEVAEIKMHPDFRKVRSIMRKEFEIARQNGLSREAATEMVHHAFHSPIMVEDWRTGEQMSGLSPKQILINRLNELVTATEIKDIAYLFLGFQNEFGFDEEDAAEIKILGSIPNLYDWLEFFGDEVLDSLFGTFEPDVQYSAKADEEDVSEHMMVERFSEQTIQAIVEQARKETEGQQRVNVFRHPAFIEGFIKQMAIGQATMYQDADG